MYTLAMDIGGTKIALGLYDAQFNLVRRAQHPTDINYDSDAFVRQLTAQSVQLMDEHNARGEVRSMGVVAAIHANKETGVIIDSTNIPPLRGVPLGDALGRALNMPVVVDNDANGATLAENRLGAGKGHDHMVYVTISTGVGGGIISDGRVIRGKYGTAGEIGHMKVTDQEDFVCHCGKTGCAESLAAGPHIARYVLNALKSGEDSLLKSAYQAGENITAKEISMAAQQGDVLSVRALERAGHALGDMLSSLFEVLSMDCVVYGGSVCKAGDLIIGPMLKRFRDTVSVLEHCPVAFAPAALGDDACLCGAAILGSEGAR